MTQILFLTIPMLSTFLLSWVFYKYGQIDNLFNVPNSRSSHAIPILGGGGIVIIFVLSISIFLLESFGSINFYIYKGLLFCSIVVGFIGFIDDIRNVSPLFRLFIHLAVALLGVYLIGGFNEVLILGHMLHLGWFGFILAIFYSVWMLNLYNFMDGIDGIASIQAITVCIIFSIINFTLFPEFEPELGKVYLLLASCLLGFLPFNFPKARIFLGDTGSGFLGIILAFLSIESTSQQPLNFWIFLILMSVFIVDATFTLFWRIYHNEVIYEAHSKHAYQSAARLFNSHVRVSLSILVINLLWLTPIAVLVALGLIQGIVGLGIAFTPLVLICLYFKSK